MTSPETSAVVAVLGAGVMGETLLSGLLRAGRRPSELVVAERRPERAAELARGTPSGGRPAKR